MSDFLDDWDFALRSARQCGEIVWLRQFTTSRDYGVVLYPQTAKEMYPEVSGWAGRTMHPAFMAPPMPKHEPERDQ